MPAKKWGEKTHLSCCFGNFYILKCMLLAKVGIKWLIKLKMPQITLNNLFLKETAALNDFLWRMSSAFFTKYPLFLLPCLCIWMCVCVGSASSPSAGAPVSQNSSKWAEASAKKLQGIIIQRQKACLWLNSTYSVIHKGLYKSRLCFLASKNLLQALSLIRADVQPLICLLDFINCFHILKATLKQELFSTGITFFFILRGACWSTFADPTSNNTLKKCLNE